VTNFGAFVDIGVHQDGLVHISQLSNRFVKDPRDVVSPGDRVKVRVLEVNLEKNQIALSMKPEAEAKRENAREMEEEQPQRRSKERGDRPKQQPRKPEKNSFNNPFAALLEKQDRPKPKK
jgi:protein Tex